MKHLLLALVMLLSQALVLVTAQTLGQPTAQAQVSSQPTAQAQVSSQPTAQAQNVTQPVDSAQAPDEVEVFSDTTSIDSAGVAAADGDEWDPWANEWEEWEPTNGNFLLDSFGIDGGDIVGMLFAICVLFLLFVLAPIAIIGIILYFVYKNRKERMRLAELALRNGKPIPPAAMAYTPKTANDLLWNKGIKQVFLGAGLAFLLWVILGKLGLAIGALVLCIGVGNMVIAYHERQRMQKKEMYDKMFGNDER